jgi:hypothetical protein
MRTKFCLESLKGWESSVSGLEPVAGSCEHGDEPPGSRKGREFIDCDQLSAT